MEQATFGKDASYDGLFYVCVRTTGIFCRPSCAAKKPRKSNIVYRSTVRDCLLDGFRACKRCRPLSDTGDGGEWVDRLLARIESSPLEKLRDSDLAQGGISPHRARRYFVRNFGMTFQAFHRARRMGLALEQLRTGRDQAAVAWDSSYESLSGFRDAFQRVFGATPGQSRDLECVRVTRLDTPLGPMVAGATGEGLCLLEFADRRAFERQLRTLRQRLGVAVVPGRNRHLDQLSRQLSEYFAGRRRAFDVPLVAPGSEFQQRVWEELRRIPYGQSVSYAELARRMGKPGSARAVGRANGDNRIAILIPCHRVVREDGTLCGYGGGVWRKQHLLDLERQSAVASKGPSVPLSTEAAVTGPR